MPTSFEVCLLFISSSVHSRRTLEKSTALFKVLTYINEIHRSSCPRKTYSLVVEIDDFRGWRDGSAGFKNTGCPSRWLGFDSQYPHGSLQPSCNFSLWGPDFFFWPPEAPGVYMVLYRNTCSQNIYTFKNR